MTDDERVWLAAGVVVTVVVVVAVIGVRKELKETNRRLATMESLAQRDAMRDLEEEVQPE